MNWVVSLGVVSNRSSARGYVSFVYSCAGKYWFSSERIVMHCGWCFQGLGLSRVLLNLLFLLGMREFVRGTIKVCCGYGFGFPCFSFCSNIVRMGEFFNELVHLIFNRCKLALPRFIYHRRTRSSNFRGGFGGLCNIWGNRGRGRGPCFQFHILSALQWGLWCLILCAVSGIVSTYVAAIVHFRVSVRIVGCVSTIAMFDITSIGWK